MHFFCRKCCSGFFIVPEHETIFSPEKIQEQYLSLTADFRFEVKPEISNNRLCWLVFELVLFGLGYVISSYHLTVLEGLPNFARVVSSPQ